jgi:intergrase/recombinase
MSFFGDLFLGIAGGVVLDNTLKKESAVSHSQSRIESSGEEDAIREWIKEDNQEEREKMESIKREIETVTSMVNKKN